MNKYKADLSWPAGAVKTLRNDDAIAITATAQYRSTMDYSISYKEFNKRVRSCGNELYRRGLRERHRVLIVGDNEDIINSIIWTWGAIYIGASPGNASHDESDEDIQLKAGAGNCDAIVYVGAAEGSIALVLGFDQDRMSKIHPQESYILYSSGTTKKPENKFGVEPQFFTYPTEWKGGLAHIDQIKLAERFLGEVPISQIACHGWEVAYAPHNVVDCILTGGTYHWVRSPELIPEAQKHYKTNLMSNYPLSYDPICEAFGEMIEYPTIDMLEVAGGICTPELITRIRKTIRPGVIVNSFISSASGTILTRVISANDDPEECAWLENPYLDHTLKLKMDDSNVLWYKRNEGKWVTDGDVFEKKGKYYRVIGKANEEYIQTEFAKISTWEIEQFANQLTRHVWGCGEHTYCFAMDGLPGGVRHGLVYSGPLDIKRMKKRMDKLEEYKRPHTIYQVDPEFWSLDIKISRDYMAERLHKNKKYVENVL